jgi:hypothetical protein
LIFKEISNLQQYEPILDWTNFRRPVRESVAPTGIYTITMLAPTADGQSKNNAAFCSAQVRYRQFLSRIGAQKTFKETPAIPRSKKRRSKNRKHKLRPFFRPSKRQRKRIYLLISP